MIDSASPLNGNNDNTTTRTTNIENVELSPFTSTSSASVAASPVANVASQIAPAIDKPSDDSKQLVYKMKVRPFSTFAHYRMISVKPYPKQLLLPQQEQNNEWISIRLHLNEYIHQERSIQKVIIDINGLLRLIPMLALFLGYVIRSAFQDTMELLGVFFIVFVVICSLLYREHGDKNMVILNTDRVTYLSKLFLVFMVPSTLLMTALEGSLGLLLILPILYFIYGLIVVLIVSCIHVLVALRNRCSMFLSQQDKALKNVYDEVKNMNNTLKYFHLHPQIGFHEASILINVYTTSNNSTTNSSSRKDAKQIGFDLNPNNINTGMHDPLLLPDSDVMLDIQVV